MPVHDRITEAPGLAPGPGYAHVVTATGRLAFIAGQVALDEQGQLVGPGDLGAQTRQALANLHRALSVVGADWRDVVRFNWYLRDAGQVAVLREVRDEILRPALGDLPNPASTLVEVGRLFREDLLVEVDAIAALPG
jgi:enamine deaminase RidA (YjgF/YER057c/UK114 family)